MDIVEIENGLMQLYPDFAKNVSQFPIGILFGLQPSQKRSAFSVGVGRRHSAFRYSVLMNIRCNVQQNRFKKFSAGEAGAHVVVVNSSSENQVPDSPSEGILQIKQPRWLEPGFIGPRHVEEARMRVEASLDSGSQQEPTATKHKKAWITVKENPDKGDIAKYGALKVYRSVTTGLYYAREKAKWVLFEELTYIMTPWDGEESDVDQSCLRVAWGHEGTEVAEVDLSSVATCKKRTTDPAHADEYNTSTLAEFLSARKEMVLCVSHEVKIRPNGSSARHKRGLEKRMLERAINLVDVASKFFVVFTQQAIGGFSTLPFLGAHEDSLKCIYAVAVLLRRVVETFIQEQILHGAFIMPDKEDPPQVQCHGLQLENLLPAASVRKRLLTSRCLRMTVEEFDKINANAFGGERADVSYENSENDDADIDPLIMDGVMLI